MVCTTNPSGSLSSRCRPSQRSSALLLSIISVYVASSIVRSYIMATSQSYNSIIIGSSRSAVYLSLSLAQAGRRTALVERDLVGGTCLNVGCTPTKAMVASARVAYLANRAAEFGVRTGPVSVDLGTVRQRKRDLLNVGNSFVAGMIEMTDGLELVMGDARFTGSKTVEVSLNDGSVTHLTA